jgi:hypothetical protein
VAVFLRPTNPAVKHLRCHREWPPRVGVELILNLYEHEEATGQKFVPKAKKF